MTVSPLLAALFLSWFSGPATDPVQAGIASRQEEGTLCILDLNRLGGDEQDDWLGRGLADMLIVRMSRLSDFQVIEREHLRRILEEHELAGQGIVQPIDQGHLLRADLLLVGSFAVLETGLRVETRLIRVADQEVLAAATWEGETEDVLEAAPRLCDELLESLGQPLDERRLAGIETQVPQTVDVARAYYRGVGAFEDGDYPEALSYYLEGAAHEHDFLSVDRAAIQMYYLLDQTAHAVVYADSVGRRLEREGRLQQALEFTFAAAEHCLQSLDDPATAIRFLERMVAAAERHEEETHEFAATRDELVRRWSAEPNTAEANRIQELRRCLAWGTTETGWWAHAAELSKGSDSRSGVEQPGDPDVFMWRTRAQRDLARAYAAVGRIDDSLELYREIVEDHEPLTRLPDDGMRGWNDRVRSEGHFMLLRHWQMTGTLDRDHALSDVNALNAVEDGFEFVRDFSNTDIDARARGASRYDERGHEYFDFVCPEGFQIESVRLQTEVDGIAEYSFSVPDPDGWPPQISFGRRIQKFRYTRRGDHDETIELPAGTELVSLSTSWGANKYSDSASEILWRKFLGPALHQDIRRWSVTFEISRMAPGAAVSDAMEPAGPGPTEADRKLIAQFAGRAGWELGAVLRGSSAATYTGTPALDVFAEEWIVVSLDGELFIHHRDRPLKVDLPVTINTPEQEFRPRLVRTHEGAWALLWARGADERSARCFVAVTTDLLRWETPRRVQFAPAPPDAGLRSVALAGDYDVLSVSNGGYVMLLDDGQVRRSEDLRSWGPPTQIFDRGAWYGRLTKTKDGRLWAVYQTASDVQEPWEATDWLTGYYVTDGKRYKHMCEIHVAHSLDGVEWQEFSKVVLPGQSSGLWAFPLADGRIGIGAQFNSRFMKWFATARSNTLRVIPSSLELMCHSSSVSVFASDGRIACLAPMFDHYDTHRTVLLGAGSRRLFEDFQR